MLKRILKNKKAQQTAEYALLISLVIAAVVAMQTYAQRALQGRIRGASNYMVTQTSSFGNTVQYEPYYLDQAYDVTRDDYTLEKQDNATIKKGQISNTLRRAGGFKAMSFNADGFGQD
jgi:Flp pilus assembly pilin Flp